MDNFVIHRPSSWLRARRFLERRSFSNAAACAPLALPRSRWGAPRRSLHGNVADRAGRALLFVSHVRPVCSSCRNPRSGLPLEHCRCPSAHWRRHPSAHRYHSSATNAKGNIHITTPDGTTQDFDLSSSCTFSSAVNNFDSLSRGVPGDTQTTMAQVLASSGCRNAIKFSGGQASSESATLQSVITCYDSTDLESEGTFDDPILATPVFMGAACPQENTNTESPKRIHWNDGLCHDFAQSDDCGYTQSGNWVNCHQVMSVVYAKVTAPSGSYRVTTSGMDYKYAPCKTAPGAVHPCEVGAQDDAPPKYFAFELQAAGGEQRKLTRALLTAVAPDCP